MKIRKHCYAAALAFTVAAASASAAPFGYTVAIDPHKDRFSLARVDLATGELEYIGTVNGDGPLLNFDIEGLAFAPDGRLLAADDATDSLLVFDLSSGLASPVGETYNGLSLRTRSERDTAFDYGLSFSCDGKLLLSADQSSELWTVDGDSGRASRATQVGAPLTGLASRWDGDYGLGTDGRLYKITLDKSVQAIGALQEGLTFDDGGLDFDASGQLWAILDFEPVTDPDRPNEIHRVDPLTGKSEFVAQLPQGIEGLAIAPPQCSPRGSQALPIPGLGLGGRIALGFCLLLAGLSALRRFAR